MAHGMMVLGLGVYGGTVVESMPRETYVAPPSPNPYIELPHKTILHTMGNMFDNWAGGRLILV